jgi:ParB-like chromosome segregation protein Spo0J
MKGGLVMKDKEGQITRVETACVQDNQVLALSVNRQDIERCIKVIRQYGLLTPPVVGSLADGSRLLLSGECEFLALRETGVKNVDAVTVPITEENEGDRLSLLLSSLKKSPNALSEGILITRMLGAGSLTQSQLGELLGKSVSWVNKRLCLVTRLHPAVRDLVTQRQLCPHSAQEIARLPDKVQHAFSVKAIREGLPKSSIEALVAAFNAPDCPEAIKAQIIEDPRQMLSRLADIRTTVPIRSKQSGQPFTPAAGLKQNLVGLRQHMANFTKHLFAMAIEVTEADRKLLKELRDDTAALLVMLDERLRQFPFSPGKNAMEVDSHGN